MAEPPLRREVTVPIAPARAFEVFTDRIAAWWPLATHSVHGDGTVLFVGDRLVERSADGIESVWAEVVTWEPPLRLALAWHPGAPAAAATRVTVTFEPVGTGTRVVLVHEGWDALADPGGTRDEYGAGWPVVLGAYRAAADDGETWVALLHTPVDGLGAAVFADARFAEHVLFLRRLAGRGLLVAAGPFGDREGEGMAILRLPGPDRLGDAERMATTDDGSVTGGLFTVAIRPWRVLLSTDRAS